MQASKCRVEFWVIEATLTLKGLAHSHPHCYALLENSEKEEREGSSGFCESGPSPICSVDENRKCLSWRQGLACESNLIRRGMEEAGLLIQAALEGFFNSKKFACHFI